MPRWRTFYHVVWATHLRQPLLDERIVEIVRSAIAAVSTSHRCLIHSIGFIPDHVHVTKSIPPASPIPKVMQGLKGVSSKRINEAGTEFGDFSWQAEYGILTFSESVLPRVIQYLEHQKEHHTNGTVRMEFEDVGEYTPTATQS